MSDYFLAKNSDTDEVLIDDTYVNLCLSRKFLANTLPVVTLSESAGYVVKGTPQLREIPLYGGEVIAAVGGYVNKRCPYFIWNCLKKNGTEFEIKHFICSAEIVNGVTGTSSFMGWDVDNERTNISSSYYVPDDLYVYTFSKSNTEIVYVSSLPASGNSEKRYCVTSGANAGKTYIWSGSAWIETTNAATAEKVGFQVFNANGETVFDSRFKYLDVVYSSWDYSGDYGFGTRRRIAMSDLHINCSYGNSYRDDWSRCFSFYIQGHILFEAGYQSKRSGMSPYDQCHAGYACRNLYTKEVEASDVIAGIAGQDEYMVIDVTGY